MSASASARSRRAAVVVAAAAGLVLGLPSIASTGGRWWALALGALALVCLGAALRTWARARVCRDEARASLVPDRL